MSDGPPFSFPYSARDRYLEIAVMTASHRQSHRGMANGILIPARTMKQAGKLNS
jgi:hypothetical protein